VNWLKTGGLISDNIPMFLNLAIVLMFVTALTLDLLGVGAMVWYPLRRRLPSPFTLIHFGFLAFCLGSLLLLLRGWLKAA